MPRLLCPRDLSDVENQDTSEVISEGCMASSEKSSMFFAFADGALDFLKIKVGFCFFKLNIFALFGFQKLCSIHRKLLPKYDSA